MYEDDTTKLFYLSFLLICPIVMLLIKEIGLLVAVIALIALIASGVFAIIKFITDYNCIWSKDYSIAPIFFRRSTLHSYIFENRKTIIENSGSPRKFKKFADEEIRKFFKNEIRAIEKRIETTKDSEIKKSSLKGVLSIYKKILKTYVENAQREVLANEELKNKTTRTIIETQDKELAKSINRYDEWSKYR